MEIMEQINSYLSDGEPDDQKSAHSKMSIEEEVFVDKKEQLIHGPENKLNDDVSRKRIGDTSSNPVVNKEKELKSHNLDQVVSNQKSTLTPSSSSSTGSPIPTTTPNTTTANTATLNKSMKQFMSSCTYVPMRLTAAERLQLAVLENALAVSEYTDIVDVTFSHTRKNKYTRILESLIDIMSVSCGLMTSNNLQKGEALLKKTLTENVPLFRDLFEIGRRYKIMNPSRMRDTYGKLIYLLMDAESHMVKSELQINFIKPVLTVSRFLHDKEGSPIIADPLFYYACVLVPGVALDEAQQHREVSRKELFTKYVSPQLTEAELTRVLDSLGDNDAYRVFNVQPVDRMLQFLEESFDPNRPKDDLFSLELSGGRGFGKKIFNSITYGGFSSKYFGGGACLNHDHKTQYMFVKQSLLLWREIMHFMPKLWLLADADMISEPYRLADTGQGYQRLQSCPRVGAEMQRILSSVQARTSAWVGLSVIHLGDRDVPNALIFIDKYTQVPRILKPISECIGNLPNLVSDPAFHEYVSSEWGSITGLRMQILTDFFRHGFDGSGTFVYNIQINKL